MDRSGPLRSSRSVGSVLGKGLVNGTEHVNPANPFQQKQRTLHFEQKNNHRTLKIPRGGNNI